VGFVVRYYKGSLMLHSFREAVGDGKFFQASHDFFQMFRSFWKERLKGQGKLLEEWLDSNGRLPDKPRYASTDHEIQSSTL